MTANFIYFLSVLKKAVPIVAMMVCRHARLAASAIALGEGEQVIWQNVTDTVELLAEIMAQAHAERNRQPGYAAMGRNGGSIRANRIAMTSIFNRHRHKMNAAVLSGLLDWDDDEETDYLMAARVPRTNRLYKSTHSAPVNVILQSRLLTRLVRLLGRILVRLRRSSCSCRSLLVFFLLVWS